MNQEIILHQVKNEQNNVYLIITTNFMDSGHFSGFWSFSSVKMTRFYGFDEIQFILTGIQFFSQNDQISWILDIKFSQFHTSDLNQIY